jgi:hypothetical protein
LAILVAAELFLGILLVSPTFVDRHDLARAVVAYHREPTEANRVTMEAEQEITARMLRNGRLTVAGLWVLNTGALVLVIRRLKASGGRSGKR